jgi:hypothetical protein
MSLPDARPGWKYFPLHPGTKKPILDDWPALATDNRLQLEAWAIRFPGCNWGLACGPSGIAVVDIDGEQGEESLFAYELEHGPLPPTREHSTPRGGRHLIYSGDIKPTASKLGPKIDTRGGNSYIVIPPSTFDGKPYAVAEDRHIAPIPATIVAEAGASHERVAAAPGVELDQPHNIARARKFLADCIASGRVAIEGNGGDAITYAVAAEAQSLGLSPEATFEAMQDWNASCCPPWDADELRVKIENASRYSQNEAGSFAVAPVSHRIPADALAKLIADNDTSEPPLQATIEEDHHEWCFDTFNAAEDANLPPITYHDEHKLWPRVPGGSLTQIIAQAKGYKTTFYLSELFRLVAKELRAADE